LARDGLAAGCATRRATARLELPGSGQGSVVREVGSVKTIKHSLSNLEIPQNRRSFFAFRAAAATTAEPIRDPLAKPRISD
jgi:hypothetical protein